MLAIYDPFTHQMRNRLKTTGIGLGLVRLLQDARRFEEAHMTLGALENGSRSVAEQPGKPSQKPCKAKGLKGVSRSLPGSAESGSPANRLHRPLSIA